MIEVCTLSVVIQFSNYNYFPSFSYKLTLSAKSISILIVLWLYRFTAEFITMIRLREKEIEPHVFKPETLEK